MDPTPTEFPLFWVDGQCGGDGVGKGFGVSNLLTTKTEHYGGEKKAD